MESACEYDHVIIMVNNSGTLEQPGPLFIIVNRNSEVFECLQFVINDISFKTWLPFMVYLFPFSIRVSWKRSLP